APAIPFDNAFKLTPTVPSPPKIGTQVTFALERAGAFADVWVKLELYETDAGEPIKSDDRDRAARTFWKPGDTADKRWRIGFAADSEKFSYRELGERDGLEFAYALYVGTPPGDDAGGALCAFVAWTEVTRKEDFVRGVPFPKLEEFRIES